MTWTMLDDATPTARKQHRCSDCGRCIEAGETYRRVRAVGDDGPLVHKAYRHCDLVLTAIWRADPDLWCCNDDGIDMGEYLADYLPDSALTAGFRRQWRGIEVADLPLADLPRLSLSLAAQPEAGEKWAKKRMNSKADAAQEA